MPPEIAPRPVHNPATEPTETRHETTATSALDSHNDSHFDKQSDSSSAEKGHENGGGNGNESGLNPFALLKEGAGSVANTFGNFSDQLSKLGLAAKETLMPSYDAATQSKVDKAVKGYETAVNHESLFMSMKGPRTENVTPLQKGESAIANHEDGSRTKKNPDGRVNEFTTAPTKEFPNGLTYKNIQYDQKGQMKSFETPWGTTHSRISENDANGYAKWQSTNKNGQLVEYSGAKSSQWQGKSEVDEKGFHNLVASGPNAWNMYSRLSDGSHVETHPNVEKGVLKGFETTTTLADKTKLTTNSHFEKGELVRDKNVDYKDDKGEKSNVEVDDSHKTGKYTSSAELKNIEAFRKLMDFDKNPMFNHVNSFQMNRSGNNLNFSADLDRPIDTPPPNVRVTGLGPFGGASAVPISSRINDPSGTIVTHPENPGQVDITNMRGFMGESQAYGPRGRPRGVHAGSTNSMTLYSDQNGQGHLIARSDKANVNLTAANMRGGLFGDVLSDSSKKKDLTDGLAKVRDNLDSLEFRKGPNGSIKGSFDPRADHVAINKKIDGDLVSRGLGLEATNLYFGQGKLNFDVTKTANGKDFAFKQGDLQIGVKNGFSPGETKVSISKIYTTKDASGKTHAEVEFYGRNGRTKIF